ncbi:hypothetical protein [Nostoc sp. ChiQUE01b]|uniref:hypothetical protein n=1 Tax=Nostoc sp. ChiQUE01b TaxID=3075376 RepID=UPI002AD3EB99|nr:hypothetical protein [Nostoc sp. ChiQUE01b]MDZ8257001.1 hypothetical protein [Nostoc sp. ChiQUE01b]
MSNFLHFIVTLVVILSCSLLNPTLTAQAATGAMSTTGYAYGEYIFLTPGHLLNLPPAPPLDVFKNPYRGLSPFEEEHCNLFFGRNALTLMFNQSGQTDSQVASV